jgi:hypothetical protein
MSSDPRWIMVADELLSEGMTSPGVLCRRSRVDIDEYERVPDYARLPKGLRVYDSHTGKLWYSQDDYPGYLVLVAAWGQWTVFAFNWREYDSSTSSGSAESPRAPIPTGPTRRRLLHVPSKTWLDGAEGRCRFFHEVAAPAGNVTVHWLDLPYPNTPQGLIRETAPDGQTHTVATLDTQEIAAAHLVEGSSQLVLFKVGQITSWAPVWLAGLMEWAGLGKYARPDRQGDDLVIFDYESHREAFRLRLRLPGDSQRSFLTPVGKFLVLTSLQDTHLNVTCTPAAIP